MMDKNKLQALLASYGRSVLGAAVALYMSGVTDPKTLAYSLLGALVPVALRAINPKDAAFGKVPTASQVEEAVKNLKVAKAPAKAPAKPAAKKTTATNTTVTKKAVK
jgi:hypothetical protein